MYQTYPMYHIYPASGRVPEPWHGLQVGYIWPRADISDVSDISDHRSGSRILTAGSGWIYPTSIGYIGLDQNQHSWIRNLRAKTRRFEDLMYFDVWKMTRRHQGAKLERFMLKAEPVKTGPSRLGYWSIRFFPEEIESDYDLRFSLFRNDLHVYKSKSYVLLPI
jgi:hypothetical protein